MAVAAYFDVSIPVAERSIGAICNWCSAAKPFFDELKLVRQLGPMHLFVEAIERLQEDELIRSLQFIEVLLVSAFGIQGSHFSELADEGKPVCRTWRLHAYASLCVVFNRVCRVVLPERYTG